MTQGWVGSHHYRRDSRPLLQHCHLHLKTKATRTGVIQQAFDFLYQTQFHSPRILTYVFATFGLPWHFSKVRIVQYFSSWIVYEICTLDHQSKLYIDVQFRPSELHIPILRGTYCPLTLLHKLENL